MPDSTHADAMYDLVILGGGPAGLGAALYAARYNLKVLVVSDIVGGVITQSRDVENYPGVEHATGIQMMDAWKKHCEKFGAEIKQEAAGSVDAKDKGFLIKTSKQEYEAKTILIATGAKHRELGVPGEHEFFGRGVSTCPTCDGFFFKGKDVAVIGGGDAALRGAQVMMDLASKVYLVHRRPEFRAEPVLVEMVRKSPKVEFVLGRTVKEIKGDKKVTEIVLDNNNILKVQGVFVEVGSIPNTEFAVKLGVMLSGDLIKVKEDQSTNVPGVYAAGDVTTASNNFRQIVTAASEGAIAANSIFEYIKRQW